MTSDLGTKDHYVASVKAALLAQAPECTIVDISHDVRPFDLNGAAFVLRNVWKQFPVSTVHIIGVMPEFTALTPHIVVHYMGHYFVGADNGIFSLILDEVPEDVFEITLPQGDDWTFPMRGVFATAAAHLSRKGPAEFLGKRTQGIQHAIPLQPVIDGDAIKCSVVYIDHYGNVYTNLTRSLFDSVRKGRGFSINFKRSGYGISRISRYYTDVSEGQRLALWGSNGLLMIAINGGAIDNGGGASSLFGFQLNDIIRVEFNGYEDSEDDL